jgi:hypothetical protein
MIQFSIITGIYSIFKRKYITISNDGIPWSFKSNGSRVVAIGDLHGDLEALLAILLERGMIDDEGNWCAANDHLVLNGDLASFGKTGKLAAYVINLEQQAILAGGFVHSLLGNHDILEITDSNKLARSMSMKLLNYDDYCNWLEKRNTILKIDDTLFVHAGVNRWIGDHQPARINTTIRKWISWYLGRGPKPPTGSSWIMGRVGDADHNESGSEGPLWTRSYKPHRVNGKTMFQSRQFNAPELDEMAYILKGLGVVRLVVGHAPVGKKKKIRKKHPFYHDMVIMIDTKISDKQRGVPSCLEIMGGSLYTHYCSRSERSRSLAKTVKKRYKKKSNPGHD